MRQSEYSKEYIAEALVQLMTEKEYEKITIKEITEKAGVARLTFYRNFDSIEAVLEWYINKHVEAYFEKLHRQNVTDVYETIAVSFRAVLEDNEFTQLMIKYKFFHLIKKPFARFITTLMKEMGVYEDYTPAQINFIIGGLYYNLLYYVQSDEPFEVDKIADEMIELIDIKYRLQYREKMKEREINKVS